MAFTVLGTINFQNQFGEETVATVFSEGTDWPAVDPQNALISEYVSGAGVVAASDTIVHAINKLNGNAAAIKTTADAALPTASFTAAAVTGKVLTGLGAGSNTAILSSDTILAALAKLQAQITALV